MKEGISWFTKDLQGHLLVMHDAVDVGFESRLMLAPNDSVAVVAMSNYAAADKDYFLELAAEALKIMLDLKPAAQSRSTAAASITPPAAGEDTKQKADEALSAYVNALGGRDALEK
jgi:hypothetical protein